MKRIIVLMLILLAVSMMLATRATGYGISAPVTINTLLPPHDLLAEDMGGSVLLTWYPASMGTPDYFRVYGSNTPLVAGSFSLVGESFDPTFEDSDYIFSAYYVSSVYPQGESRPSNMAYVGRLQPVMVRLSLDNSSNSAMISWDRVREADSYLVYYSDNPNAVFPSQWSSPITIVDNQYIDPLSDRRFYKVMVRLSDRTLSTEPTLNQAKRK